MCSNEKRMLFISVASKRQMSIKIAMSSISSIHSVNINCPHSQIKISMQASSTITLRRCSSTSKNAADDHTGAHNQRKSRRIVSAGQGTMSTNNSCSRMNCNLVRNLYYKHHSCGERHRIDISTELGCSSSSSVFGIEQESNSDDKNSKNLDF